MRKLLLSAALLAGFFANAQQVETSVIGFESTEGYTVGQTVVGSNGWSAFEGSETITTQMATIANVNSTEVGTQSLVISADGNVGTEEAPNPISQLLYPIDLSTPTSVSFNVNFGGTSVTNFFSDCQIALIGEDASGDATIGAGFYFDYEDYLLVYGLDADTNELTRYFFGTEADPLLFPRDTWFNVTMVIVDGNVAYYLGGEEPVFTTALNPEVVSIQNILFANDNYGSTFGIDNIQIMQELSTPNFTADSFRVYPNPANDEITVVLSHAQALEGVKIFDMNGRLVKTFQANEMNNTFNIADLNAGIYSIEVTSANGKATSKLIKN